jgi:hypothetical protein
MFWTYQSSGDSGLMPGALLVRLRAGLKKRRKRVRKSNGTRRITSKRQKVRRTGSLPGSDRHLIPALPAVGFAAVVLLGALGGGSFAGAGLRGRSLVLLPPGG